MYEFGLEELYVVVICTVLGTVTYVSDVLGDCDIFLAVSRVITVWMLVIKGSRFFVIGLTLYFLVNTYIEGNV